MILPYDLIESVADSLTDYYDTQDILVLEDLVCHTRTRWNYSYSLSRARTSLLRYVDVQVRVLFDLVRPLLSEVDVGLRNNKVRAAPRPRQLRMTFLS